MTILPPFPDNVTTHPLLVIDYELIKAGDNNEIERLWKAATDLGFWYLKNHDADAEVDEMFKMGEETMQLTLEEKMEFEQGDDGCSFGYKAAGANATDENGNLDTIEFINVAKDDALAYPAVVHRTYPAPVNARMESTIRPFVEKSIKVNNAILATFECKLGLPAGALLARHTLSKPSGSEARCIRNPPRQLAQGGTTSETDPKAAVGAHTDFGSLSFLHNRLGGLQVLPPGYKTWQYVRPIPDHAVCNVGDVLALFSGGILRSNLHRVVPPPGAQAAHPRWSLVFFTRPGLDVVLHALEDESQIIRNKIAGESDSEKQRFRPDVTAGEWFTRRIKNQRIKNRTGPETWWASRGTEHKPQAV